MYEGVESSGSQADILHGHIEQHLDLQIIKYIGSI